MTLRGQTRMFDGAAGAPLHRTRAEQREAAREDRAACERARTVVARAAEIRASHERFAARDLTAAGDLMQSAASRVSAGIRRMGADRALSYGDSMALLELDSAVAAWTEARRGA